MILLSPTVATAAIPDPVLKRSDLLDTRRLGKVSEDERSVLRVEWRAAITGAEEARNVQDMLDGLRRMEGTVTEIGRLIRNVPAGKPGVADVAAEAPEPGDNALGLALAASAAIASLLFWWFRRRNSTGHSKAVPIPKTFPEASPPDTTVPTAALPSKPPPVATVPTEAALASTPIIEMPAAKEESAVIEMTAEPESEAPPMEPGAVTENTGAKPIPTSVTTPVFEPVFEPEVEPDVEPTSSPEPTNAKAATASPKVESPMIDFLLEDADPEVVAREDAKLQQLQALNRRRDPERQQASNVEPTLELAGIMLSLGLEQGAAQALVEYTEANPRQALAHWLKLLDIYRNSGHREDFAEAAEKLRQNFNIQAEDWAKANASDAPTLESFSRVAEHVQEIWSQPPECIAYLQHLLVDNREGSRAGFPQPVAEEMLLLIEILKLTSGAAQAAATQRATT